MNIHQTLKILLKTSLSFVCTIMNIGQIVWKNFLKFNNLLFGAINKKKLWQNFNPQVIMDYYGFKVLLN
jgi:hypothetical protein